MIQHKDYKIKHEIGSGGMATVYLAYDKEFKCDVAIKILNKELVYNKNIKSRFLDEARKLYKMNHPNIIRVTRILKEDENVGFVMEYFDALTLKDLIEQQGKLSEERIIHLMLQMLDSLQYIHQQGIVHRDIKPSNFMVNRDGFLKLLDFGIAKNNDSKLEEYTQTAASSQMGTPMYMSPEQINESKNVTAQSDIYSLGVVLWYMVKGERPYYTNSLSTFQLLSKIVNEKLKDTHSVFQPIISKCTSKDLELRYQDCHQIKNDLMKINIKPLSNLESTKWYGESKPVQVSNEAEATRLADFENAEKKQKDLKSKKLSPRNIIILGGSILILCIFFILISNKYNKKNDKVDDNPPVVTEVPAKDSTAPIIKIDSTDLISETDIITKVPEENENKIKQKKITNNKSNKNSTTTRKHELPVDNTIEIQSPDPKVTTPENHPDPVIEKTESPKKESKLKKTFKNIKGEIKDLFRKKNK